MTTNKDKVLQRIHGLFRDSSTLLIPMIDAATQLEEETCEGYERLTDEQLTQTLKELADTGVQISQLAPARTAGLHGRWFIADRKNKVDFLLDNAISSGVVKVQGPAGTGKTSLMHLLCDAARAQGWGRVLELSAADCSGEKTIDNVIASATGSDALDWGTIWEKTCHMQEVPGDPGNVLVDFSQMQLVCIDEAHLMFKPNEPNIMFWANMKRQLQTGGLHKSVRVVFFVVHGNGPTDDWDRPPKFYASPTHLENIMAFDASDTDMDSSIAQLALDADECNDLWNQFITRGGYTNFFQDADLRQELLEMTSGHVGLLTALMDELHGKLNRLPRQGPINQGVGDRLIRYLFATGQALACVKDVRGVVSSAEELDMLSTIMPAMWTAGPRGCYDGVLAHAWYKHKQLSGSNGGNNGGDGGDAWDQREVLILYNELKALLIQLYHSGYVLQHSATRRYRFPSPLHYSYYLMQLRSHPHETLELNSHEDFLVFLHHSISRMSASSLQQSYKEKSVYDPKRYERHYQVEWFRAATSLLPAWMKISPDVGKVFKSSRHVDFWIHPGSPDLNTEPEDFMLPQGWAVELLVHGNRVDQHAQHLTPGDTHVDGNVALPCTQYAVLDFWTEEPQMRAPEGAAYYAVHFAADFKTAQFLAPGSKGETLHLS